jgi:hypothetical protein
MRTELTRPQRQEQTAERLNRVVESDRRFFARRKHRNHRLRQAAQIEIELTEIVAGAGMEPPPGLRWFKIIKQIPSDVRARVSIALPETTDTDIPERECEALFTRACLEKWSDALTWWKNQRDD